MKLWEKLKKWSEKRQRILSILREKDPKAIGEQININTNIDKTLPFPQKKWKISELFKEDNGKLSATRLALLLWTAGVMVLIIVVAIRDIEYINKLPYDSLITIMAMLMGGKVIQKYGEEKNNK